MVEDGCPPALPENYRCGVCGKSAVRLWRMVGFFEPDLFCYSCGSQHQEVPGTNGVSPIGDLVPAFPSPDGYYGYVWSDVSPLVSAQWEALPLRGGSK